MRTPATGGALGTLEFEGQTGDPLRAYEDIVV